MKTFAVSILSMVVTLNSFSQEKNLAYFGQTPPGINAIPFNAGPFFEDEMNRRRSFNFAFSPDGKELFFSFYKATKEKPEPPYEIKTCKVSNGQWTIPETASFSGVFSDVDLNFTPDGQYIFYASDRPQPSSIGLDIYYSVKTQNGWSEPIYAGNEINTTEGEVYPSVSIKKNVFFRSSRSGGYGQDDIYRAEWVNGNFINVKNLGPNINTPYGESNAVIATDESYILFCSSRPESDNKQNIYVSFQTGDNTWTPAINLGPEINIESSGAPTLSPDGKFLFYKKKSGVHWISTQYIENLKPASSK